MFEIVCYFIYFRPLCEVFDHEFIFLQKSQRVLELLISQLGHFYS